jgi:hypothetical protein
MLINQKNQKRTVRLRAGSVSIDARWDGSVYRYRGLPIGAVLSFRWREKRLVVFVTARSQVDDG